MLRTPQQKGSSAGLHLPEWSLYVLMGIFAILVVLAGFMAFTQTRNLVGEAPLGASGPAAGIGVGGGPGAEESGTGEQASQAQSIGTEQVHVLLLGIDERQSETGPFRTDTIILLTLDPVTRQAAMLSIPRDLWVAIPGYDEHDRINTAHFIGDRDQYPGGGGPALAMETVRQNFGIDVDYYITVNFQAFLSAIDQIGCVPIEVPEAINDPTYPALDGYGYDPFSIDAGEHCMDSATLLKYARTRATFGGDFDRAARQQAVIRAVRDHVLSTNQLPTLLARAPELYATVSGGVNTNLSLPQLLELARLAASVDEASLCGAVINGPYIEQRVLPDASQILVPVHDRVRELVLEVETGTGVCDPERRALMAQVEMEQATLRVLNGTGRDGLATRTADRLVNEGFVVAAFGTAPTLDYTQTVVTSFNGKEATARYLAQWLGLPESAVVIGGTDPEADIEIILGMDYTE